MKDSMLNDPWLRDGPFLKESWDNISGKLLEALTAIGEIDIATQFARVMVPLQGINGSENEFSFMAFPVPRLTREQRERMELRDERSIIVSLRNGRIQIDLDDFGQINWFYVLDLPEQYHQLARSLAALREAEK